MIALEHLLDGSVTARNFDRLRSLVLDTGGQSVGIRFGTTTVTWPGGDDTSNTMTVPHGLGTAPVGVWVSANSQAGTGAVIAQTDGSNVTNIFVFCETNGGFTPLNTATTVVSWLVIG